MKEIILKSLVLRDFKGIKEFTFTPNQELTSVFGTNKSGKTTLQNSLIWLFWGKDKLDRKDYQIKTLDENNVPISQIEHEVCGVFLIDGEETKLQRIYKEKWTKSRGEENESLTGHVTDFFWNDSPKNLGEYTTKLKEVICDEVLFKMITNPLFFNDDKIMPWLKRREVLTNVVGGEESDQSIAESDPKFKELFDRLTNKSLTEYKKEISSKKKKLDEAKKQIPARIDELARNTPEAPEKGFDAIEDTRKVTSGAINDIDSLIMDKTKGTEQFYLDKTKRVEEIGTLKVKKSEIEQAAKEQNSKASLEYNSKTKELDDSVALYQKSIDRDSGDIKRNKASNDSTKEQLPPLREEIKQLGKQEFIFDENLAECPACKRRFEEDDISARENELRDNFNTHIAKKIEAINIKGKYFASSIKTINGEILELEANVELAKEEMKAAKDEVAEHKGSTIIPTIESILLLSTEYILINDGISKLEFENNQVEPKVNVDDLNAEEIKLSKEVDELDRILATKDTIDKAATRKQELLDDQKKYAQQIADLEKDEFIIENFEKAKSDRIEKPINDLFKTVRFKLYKTQLNEGFSPCCECLINGVPFAAANSADQIKSGIEIINVLNKFFQVSLPVVLDNAESVVTPLPETSNQLIKLYASEKDLTLRVE